MKSKTVKVIGIAVIAYIFSTVLSYTVFSNTSKKSELIIVSPPVVKENGELSFDDKLPKTEPCPLNGIMYSKSQKEWWEKHRPLGVMVENHEESRPQSGLSSADVIYEAVAEGGITRFLTVFYCKDAGTVGPVRSARTYFLDFISEYGDYPLYVHVGGAHCEEETGSGCANGAKADALGQIRKYGWQVYNDLNQFSIGFPTFWRDIERLGHPVATEHTMYSTTTKLWDYAKTRGLTNVDKKDKNWDNSFIPYKFKEDSSEKPQTQSISFEFWEGYKDYTVAWQYDNKTNTYLRSNGGKPHTDLNTKKQLSTKNIIFLFMRETSANDGYDNNAHLLYGTKGTGTAWIFMDGEKIEGTWTKADRLSRTIIKDSRGREIEFNRGTLWFEIVPTDTNLKVE